MFGNNSIDFLPNNNESSIFLGFNVNFWIILISTFSFGFFTLFVIYDIRKSQIKKTQYDFELLNQIGITKSQLNPRGIVYVKDEVWSAESYNLENIPINLITAVPSIETFANIKNNKYTFSRLINRYKDANLPTHKKIDFKRNKQQKPFANKHKNKSYIYAGINFKSAD